jgi:phosphoglycolate phosphatase
MKKYDTVIFDMDGTLLNTIQDLTDSVNYMLEQFSYPTKTVKEVCSYVGNGVKLLVERAIPEGADNPRFDEAFECFRAHYKLHCEDKTAPYDGVCELISKLKKCGYKMAIVSNKFDAALKELAKKFFPEVDVVIGEREGVNKKPSPDMVEIALKELGSKKESSVFIGDSDVDYLTAKNAELDCISVLWGFRDRDFLSSFGANVFAETADEVFDIINA